MHVTDRLTSAERRRARIVAPTAALLALVLAMAACGDGEQEVLSGAPVPTSQGPIHIAGSDGRIEIRGVDYAYEGLSDALEADTVPAGSELSFSNASETEVHEMIVVRIDRGEVRRIEELLQLPKMARDRALQVQGVALALPGEQGVVVEGDLILREPGRYALFCTVPIGADPQAYRETTASPLTQGPQNVTGRPPHFTAGMSAQLTVVG